MRICNIFFFPQRSARRPGEIARNGGCAKEEVGWPMPLNTGRSADPNGFALPDVEQPTSLPNLEERSSPTGSGKLVNDFTVRSN